MVLCTLVGLPHQHPTSDEPPVQPAKGTARTLILRPLLGCGEEVTYFLTDFWSVVFSLSLSAYLSLSLSPPVSLSTSLSLSGGAVDGSALLPPDNREVPDRRWPPGAPRTEARRD